MSNYNFTGFVQTVTGRIKPEEMGITLPHEHLLSSAPHVLKKNSQNKDKDTFNSPLDFKVLSRLRYSREVNKDNCSLENKGTAIEEISYFKEHGGKTVVDATSIGIFRDARGLKKISEVTKLNIIMGSSYYVEETYPKECNVFEKSEDEICEDIVRDINDGVDGSKIRSGLIGEVGCSWPITACEKKVLRASAKAQIKTGAPLMIHPGRNPNAPLEIIEELRISGADLKRTIICHIDRTVDNKVVLRKMLESGCVLEYDLFGTEHSYNAFKIGVDMPNDSVRLKWLNWIIDEGYANQILISHDIFFKQQLVRFGGHGYGHILSNVVPMMQEKRINEENINRILIENPKRLFTFE